MTPIRSKHECAALCDVKRARRLEPEQRLDREPLASAVKRWTGRVLKPAQGVRL